MLVSRKGWRNTFRATFDRAWREPPSTPAPPPSTGDSHVSLNRVTMNFGTRRVFDSLNCRFPRGHISVVLGSSGSGKSTILRLIGGLIRPQTGSIVVDGQEISRLSERGLRTLRSKLGMLFQGGALLDSYSVFDNLALLLREQRIASDKEIADEVHSALAAVGVADADGLLPGQLSGGMLRRVALARAIIRKPSILLCDEPFSGLDPLSIKRIESLLVGLNRQFAMTVIVVSHHIPSTLRMAEQVLLLLGNRVVQGSPTALRRSDDLEVREFLSEDLDHPTPQRPGA